MTSLYQRLFTYRERPKRSPLEDFLTEALADLLNRIPGAIGRSLVSRMLDLDPTGAARLDHVWPDGAAATWSTQRIIQGGRLDLLLEIGGQPTLVVESKIGAGFHEQAADDAGCRRHQLATYGRWLREAADPAWGGALVLLTHWTPAPTDFLVEEETYGCRHRSVFRWADLFRWLHGLATLSEGVGANWTPFAAELASFLKEREMDTDLATGHDLAALQVYVSSADRVRNSIEQIWEHARNAWRPISQQTEYPLEVSTKFGCVWKYRYLARSDLRDADAYLAVGIRFPSVGDHAPYLDPGAEPYLFVEIGSGDDGSPVDAIALSDQWKASDGLKLAKLPLRHLPSDPDTFIAEAKAWASEHIGEAARLLA